MTGMTAREHDDLIRLANRNAEAMRRELDLWSTSLTDRQPYLSRLDSLTTIIEWAEQARYALVQVARNNRVSWTEISQRLGTTKQAAHQLYRVDQKPTPVDDAQLMIGGEQ